MSIGLFLLQYIIANQAQHYQVRLNLYSSLDCPDSSTNIISFPLSFLMSITIKEASRGKCSQYGVIYIWLSPTVGVVWNFKVSVSSFLTKFP